MRKHRFEREKQLKKYKVILFDLDGTLTNPEAGLVSGFEYAFKKLNINYGERESLKRFIGPPLHLEWQKEFGFTPEQSAKAIEKFREYYDVYGWWDNKPYYGIHDMLRALKESGKVLAVATSKPEDTAKRVLDLFGLTEFFDFIGGALRSTERDKKSEVISYVLNSLGVSDKESCVLIGDRSFDAEGARLAGIDSIGVLWGHGTKEELVASGFERIVSTPEELSSLLI